eukprot:144165-Lingulodinium_polyedra.AAC.1
MRAPENWCAHGVRERAMCEPLRATSGRFDGVFVWRLKNATQRCGRIDRSPPQRLANRALASSMRTR